MMTSLSNSAQKTDRILAANILKSTHPIHPSFLAWLNGKEASKRQARKFLSLNPQYVTSKPTS